MNHSILSRLRAAPLALTLAFALLIATLISSVLIASSALAEEDKKTFTVSIYPPEIPAGVATDVTFTFENTSVPMITMGSANITIPDGIEVTGHSGVIELRNMKLGERKADTNPQEYTFTVTATCPEDEDPVEWTIAAKQANNFSGDGNNFIHEGSFPELAVTCPDDDDPDPPEPETFTCTGSGECSLSQSYLNTSVKLTAARNTTLFLELSRANDKPMACGEPDGQGFDMSAAILFDVQGNQISKIIEITLSDVYEEGFEPEAFNPADFKVCFGADKRFEGSTFDEEHSQFWVGIIDMCGDDWPKGRPFPGPSQEKPTPCVVSIELIVPVEGPIKNKVVIVVWSPPGDPLIKIG